jgi:hypothetical protein
VQEVFAAANCPIQFETINITGEGIDDPENLKLAIDSLKRNGVGLKGAWEALNIVASTAAYAFFLSSSSTPSHSPSRNLCGLKEHCLRPTPRMATAPSTLPFASR